MQTVDFRYELPTELIAQQPLERRSASRLLVLDGASGKLEDLRFLQLPKILRRGDLLVLNNTRVVPARLFGTKETGGRVELLVERLLDTHRMVAQARSSKPLRSGIRLHLEGGVPVRVMTRHGDFYELRFECRQPVTSVLERVGHVPLPPYITRVDTPHDRERYQTIYAKTPGAVAAPTAGLHFDSAMFAQLKATGVEIAFITLHVGAGTFQPLRAADIRSHHMHPEYVEVSERVCSCVRRTKKCGGRVVAVGTTVVRALETAAHERVFNDFTGETDLYIFPGYRFQVVDAMLTNFHLPESSLLILVCAFAGRKQVLNAYRHAVEQRYRFYSYGDVMFVTPERRDTSGKIQDTS